MILPLSASSRSLSWEVWVLFACYPRLGCDQAVPLTMLIPHLFLSIVHIFPSTTFFIFPSSSIRSSLILSKHGGCIAVKSNHSSDVFVKILFFGYAATADELIVDFVIY